MDSDVDLVAAALSGRSADFVPIVERYQRAVFGVALARIGNFHDAEDVAQTVLLNAFTRLDTLKDPRKLGPWLRTMAINRSLDLVRSRKNTVDIDEIDDGGVDHRGNDASVREDVRWEVARALSTLNRRLRETVALFYVDGYTVEEVARIQSAPVGTVKSRLHDARKRLKREMMDTVEEVVKSGAPGDDFKGRVFDMLCQHERPKHLRSSDWTSYDYLNAVTELGRLCRDGADGAIDGFAKALESPHSPTRVIAVRMLHELASVADFATGPNAERIRRLVVEALEDSNKKVRGSAIIAIRDMAIDDDVKRRAFVQPVVAMLEDKSLGVRATAARLLGKWPADVPLEAAARALADADRVGLHRQHKTEFRSDLRDLTNAVIDARKAARTEG